MRAKDRFSKFDTTIQNILCDIGDEVLRAKRKHPEWQGDYIYAAAIVAEESGELIRAAVQYVLEDGNASEMTKEAIHTAATAVRFINRS
jgi:hypothetical protein